MTTDTYSYTRDLRDHARSLSKLADDMESDERHRNGLPTSKKFHNEWSMYEEYAEKMLHEIDHHYYHFTMQDQIIINSCIIRRLMKDSILCGSPEAFTAVATIAPAREP